MAPNRRLKQARELRGWSQAKVAEHIETDATTVSRWERGIFSPTPYFRERLCKLFGKNAAELGLVETIDLAQGYEHDGHSLQLPPVFPHLQAHGEQQGEGASEERIVILSPPSWPERTDTFSYIMHSAAHDQQAHMLWENAYVRALCGQYGAAQQLGEASLSAFEHVGHMNATAIREWLNQQELTPSPTTNVPPTPLPILPDQHKRTARSLVHGRGVGIALIFFALVVLVLAGISLGPFNPTALTSSPTAHASSTLQTRISTTSVTGSSGKSPPMPTPTLSTAPTAEVAPSSLGPPECFLESLGYRCDLRLWLFTNEDQGKFSWQISGSIVLVHTPLHGTGTSGQATQITIYVQPGQKGQVIFIFTFASFTYSVSVNWES